MNIIETTCLKKEGKRGRKNSNFFSTLRYMMDYVDDDSVKIEIIGTMEELKKAQNITKEVVPQEGYLSYIIPVIEVEGDLQ